MTSQTSSVLLLASTIAPVANNFTSFPGNGSTVDSCDFWSVVFRVVVLTVFCGVISLLGIVGNVVAILVLRHDWRRSSMSILFSVLGAYDVVFLLLSLYQISFISGFYYIMKTPTSVHFDRVMVPLTWYVGNVARTGRNWTAVVVAVDRFVAVYNPLAASRLSNPCRARLYALSITIATVVYNIPRLLEHEIREKKVVGRENLPPAYRIVYGSVMFCVFIIVGPIVLLTIFNTLLTLSILRASTHRRMHLTPHQKGARLETKMLIILIAVFIVAELPGSVVQVILMLLSPTSCQFWTYVTGTVNALTVTNSSINFIIYFVCGKRFRENMVATLCRRGRNDRAWEMSRMSSSRWASQRGKSTLLNDSRRTPKISISKISTPKISSTATSTHSLHEVKRIQHQATTSDHRRVAPVDSEKEFVGVNEQQQLILTPLLEIEHLPSEVHKMTSL